MNRKYIQLFVVLVLLIVSMLVPTKNAYAACPYDYGCSTTCTTGQNCWYKDPAYTTSSGQYCSADVITVAGSLAVSGTYGQIYDELRWSAHCIANWTRGTVYASNNAYQMGIRAYPSNSGYYTAWYITGVAYGSQKYTLMVDGRYAVRADAGLYGSLCKGAQDSKGRYTGWGGTPNCTNLYNPLASYSG